jgi:hypothetical protein
MPVFFDRRTGEMHEVESGSPEHLGRLYGTGQEGFRQLFPGDTSQALTPWRQAGGLKTHMPFEQEKVNEAVRQPESSLTDVDPRNLKATQPYIMRAPLEHYMHPQAQESGRTYADREQAGNRYPVIYSRTHPATGDVENLILSGHHRATAALLGGQFLRARYVQGGFGKERKP